MSSIANQQIFEPIFELVGVDIFRDYGVPTPPKFKLCFNIRACHYSLTIFKYSVEAYKPSLTTFMSGVQNPLTIFRHSSKHSML